MRKYNCDCMMVTVLLYDSEAYMKVTVHYYYSDSVWTVRQLNGEERQHDDGSAVV